VSRTISITVTDEQFAAFEAMQDSYPAGGVFVDVLSGYSGQSDIDDSLVVIIEQSSSQGPVPLIKWEVAADGSEHASTTSAAPWSESTHPAYRNF
jgi:hypothetical protein